MGYQPLALKWRPAKFKEVVSQQVPVRILKNTRANGQIFPGLVFFGSSAAGKTTMARIYAKALNCSNYDGDVCGTCDVCQGIANGGSLAYIEQDAASRGNVDDVHELKKALRYEVPGVKYRVVCIDECHMMSAAAWNAMLKLIEEPPEHVVFIFVTTEIRKVPVTILSRCYALQFRSIGFDLIEGHLRKVALAEGVALTDKMIEAIARRSEGRMRDAITMLEQLALLSEGKEISEDTLVLAGVCGQDVYAKLFDLVNEGNLESGLGTFRSWLATMGPADFLRGFEDYLHKLFLHLSGLSVHVVFPSVKVTWEDTMVCISNIWEMQEMIHSHFISS